MNEDLWWDKYRETLAALPFTGEDEQLLFEVLVIAGYYRQRSYVLPRPSWLCPERAANAAWRLSFLAPDDAREIGAAFQAAPPVRAKTRPEVLAVLSGEPPPPWWADDRAADYWYEVEKHFVGYNRGEHATWVRLLRSPAGKAIFMDFRETRRDTCWVDPKALAYYAVFRPK